MMRGFIRRKRRERSEKLSKNLAQARADFAAIVEMIITDYKPERVYQWGSPVDGKAFQEISDIDIAVAGIEDPKMFLRLYEKAKARTAESVLIPVQILESGYTAVETLFMRIPQAFKNNLSADRWHEDLLEKMAVEIVETRPRVITEETHKKLSELMRFRHFKRYYFEMDFDWRKIDFLMQLFHESIPLLTADLRAFEAKIMTALE